MNVITHEGFTFTINSTFAIDEVKSFRLQIESPRGRIATAILAEIDEVYALLDIRFTQAIGVHGMLMFAEALEKITDTVIPMIVEECSSVSPYSDMFNAIAQIAHP